MRRRVTAERKVDPWLERRSERHGGRTGRFHGAGAGEDGQYRRDRARVIHSASFRALQSKTQVLGLGESDFYRTRLTHSLEVAQIGSGIAAALREAAVAAGRDADAALVPSFALVEAICLAHDIGHPPFGHGGEVALNAMMRTAGGFEANGQTLRILARLGEYSADCGLDPTRRTMLGTVKYPVPYSVVHRYPEGLAPPGEGARDISGWAPPKCVYDGEAEVLEWLLDPFCAADRERLTTLETPARGHLRTRHKPFDTSVMELADDIAYGVHDLEDALALGLVEREAWDEQVAPVLVETLVDDDSAARDRRLFSVSARDRKHAISKLVGFFIGRIALARDEAFESPLLGLEARMEPDAHHALVVIKDFVMEHVIRRPELQQLQHKGQRVIVTLFEVFSGSPGRLLPREVREEHERIGERAIADYLAAMTDVSAGKLYHKLTSPAAGSIYDRP